MESRILWLHTSVFLKVDGNLLSIFNDEGNGRLDLTIVSQLKDFQQ